MIWTEHNYRIIKHESYKSYIIIYHIMNKEWYNTIELNLMYFFDFEYNMLQFTHDSLSQDLPMFAFTKEMDMGIIGIPCPLFSALNQRTYSADWNPFAQSPGSMDIHWAIGNGSTGWICCIDSLKLEIACVLPVFFAVAAKGNKRCCLYLPTQVEKTEPENSGGGGGALASCDPSIVSLCSLVCS